MIFTVRKLRFITVELTQECDWDAYGSCSVFVSHDRTPLKGLSSCPSTLKLGSFWGFDLQGKKLYKVQSESLIEDLVMKIDPPSAWGLINLTAS